MRDVLAEVAARFHDVALVATREAERRAELAALAPQVLDVPSLDSDVNDLAGLLGLRRSPAPADDGSGRLDTDGLARRPRPGQHDARS